MRSNCIIWAITMYYRRRSRGVKGYIKIRRSHFGPFPHVLYEEPRTSGTSRVVSYKPTAPVHSAIPPPLFVGSVRWGDKP